MTVCHRCGRRAPAAETGEIIVDEVLYITLSYLDTCEECARIIEQMLESYLQILKAVSS